MSVRSAASLSRPVGQAMRVASLCVLVACGESEKARRTADSIRLAAHFDSLAADSTPEPAAAPQPRPAPSVQQAQAPAAASSGWLSGDAALRQQQEARERMLAQRRASAGARPDLPTSSSPSVAEQRRRAGLASYADCNLAESNVQKITSARREGGKLYSVNINGIRNVDSAQAALILADAQRFIAEKCRP